jgi:hypothetical protein
MKTLKLIALLIFSASLILSGCQKAGVDPDQNSTDQNQFKKVGYESSVTPTIDYCGDSVVFPIVGDGWVPVGTLTAGNDETNFYVSISMINNYNLAKAKLYIGTEASVANLIIPPAHYPDTSLMPNLKMFNPPVTEYTYVIPKTDIVDDCFAVVTYMLAEKNGIQINAWAGDMVVGSGEPRPYYFNFCLEPCQPTSPDCETAYAYGSDISFCFNTFGFNNWGWTNGLISPGDVITLKLYAGAAHCDLTKGTHVGYFDIDYDGSVANITYTLFSGFTLDETHVYVGNDPLPMKKNGTYTVAPGQYPYKHDDLNGATTDTYTIDGLSGDIYVIGHGVVCGDYPEVTQPQTKR